MLELCWVVFGFAAAVCGGGLGAKLAGMSFCQGALVGTAAAVAALLASLAPGLDRNLTMPMAGLIAAGVAGSAVGLSAPRTAPILIGTALPPLLGMLMLDAG